VALRPRLSPGVPLSRDYELQFGQTTGVAFSSRDLTVIWVAYAPAAPVVLRLEEVGRIIERLVTEDRHDRRDQRERDSTAGRHRLSSGAPRDSSVSPPEFP
jgi:hypothetical protein